MKKKRKPDFPVRKPDAELTSETIVQPISKKRKFLQLFQWCHSTSAAAGSAASPPDPYSKKKTKKTDPPATTSQKPKIKPKLKGKKTIRWIAAEECFLGLPLIKMTLIESAQRLLRRLMARG